MYKGNFSTSFVKWAVIIFLFPIFFGGIILRLADRIIGKKKAEDCSEPLFLDTMS